MLSRLVKAAVGTALLPVGVIIDTVTFPAVAEGDRESTTVKLAKSVIDNVEKAVSDERENNSGRD